MPIWDSLETLYTWYGRVHQSNTEVVTYTPMRARRGDHQGDDVPVGAPQGETKPRRAAPATEDEQPREVSSNTALLPRIPPYSLNPRRWPGEDDATQDVGGVRAHEAVLGDDDASEQLAADA